VTHGLFFFVILTSRGSVQTGHGNIRVPYNSAILQPSFPEELISGFLKTYIKPIYANHLKAL